MIVGFQPDADLMALPPLAGSVQATTGKATAISPLTGTVVVVALPDAVEVEMTPVDEVEPRRDVPQPARTTRPAAANADSGRPVVRRVGSRLGLRIIIPDDRPGHRADEGTRAPGGQD
jgi:hypothetical protein